MSELHLTADEHRLIQENRAFAEMKAHPINHLKISLALIRSIRNMAEIGISIGDSNPCWGQILELLPNIPKTE